jgi:hypothetical protein
MGRFVEDPYGRALLDDPSRVHHSDPVAYLGQDRQVVGDEQKGQAEFLLERLEQRQHLSLDHHVEGGGRLVGDHHFRPAGQGHGDHDPLALPAGQLVGEVPGSPGRQPDPLHQLGDSLGGAPVGGRAIVKPDGFRHLFADALHRVQRVHGALEDDGCLVPPDCPEPAPGHRQHVLALQQDLAGDPGAGWEETEDGVGDRRLSASGFPGQADGLAGLDAKVDTPDRGHRPLLGPVLHPEVADLEDAHRRRSLGLRTSSSA